MPALRNYRQERFVMFIVEGKSANQAYIDAGYKPDNANAVRLTTNDKVKARIAELRAETARKTTTTAAGLAADALRLQKMAEQQGNVTAAVAALKERGVLTGVRVEKREMGAPGEFAWMEKLTTEQLRGFVEGTLELSALRPPEDERND